MVIASILMSLGMMMLSPMLISLPFVVTICFGRWMVHDSWVIIICNISCGVIYGFDQNVHYLSLAFWQIIMTAGPIGYCIGNRSFDWSNSSSYVNSGNDSQLCSQTFCGFGERWLYSQHTRYQR